MTPKRMYFLLLGLTLLTLVAFVAGAYEINGLLGKQATKLANLKLESETLHQQQTGLKRAKQDVATYSELQKITQQIVPQDKDQAAAVREIIGIASKAGVTLTGISFPASNLGSTTGGSTGTVKSPGAALSAKPALSQLTAVPNIPGVYQLQITLQNDGDTAITYSKFYKFLSGLESNRRTAEVASIVIQPEASNRNLLTFVLTINEYIKPS